MAFKRILHPTGLEREAEPAFAHALRIAAAGPSTLTLMHVGTEGSRSLDAMPGVRGTLRHGGFIHKAEGAEELLAMGIGVRKLVAEGDPVQACLDHLAGHETDIIVMHTHQRDGAAAWLHAKVAEPIARQGGRPALILPAGAKGFVRADSGEVSLRHVLVPVAQRPSPARAIATACDLADALGATGVQFTLLHVGDERTLPAVERTERPGWAWEALLRPGDVVGAILQAERELRPDLVVMATARHDGLMDSIRGSRTERVLRQIKCPMLICLDQLRSV